MEPVSPLMMHPGKRGVEGSVGQLLHTPDTGEDMKEEDIGAAGWPGTELELIIVRCQFTHYRFIHIIQ